MRPLTALAAGTDHVLLPWKGETNTNTISNIETGRFGGETLRAKSFAVEQGARRTMVEKDKDLVARLRKEFQRRYG